MQQSKLTFPFARPIKGSFLPSFTTTAPGTDMPLALPASMTGPATPSPPLKRKLMVSFDISLHHSPPLSCFAGP